MPRRSALQLTTQIPSGFALLEGENPIWHGRTSLKSQWGLILFGLLTLIIVIGLVLLLVAWLRTVSSEFLVTNRRIYVKYGIVGRRVVELKNEWVTNFAVSQGIIGRALNFGNVMFVTPGQFLGSTAMVGVSDPLNVKSLVENTIQRFKKAQEIGESINRLEEEYNLGRVEKSRHDEVKRKYEEELKKYS